MSYYKEGFTTLLLSVWILFVILFYFNSFIFHFPPFWVFEFFPSKFYGFEFWLNFYYHFKLYDFFLSGQPLLLFCLFKICNFPVSSITMHLEWTHVNRTFIDRYQGNSSLKHINHSFRYIKNEPTAKPLLCI